MLRAHGLVWRVVSASVLSALRRCMLHAQRNVTARCFPDSRVTGTAPPSAARWSAELGAGRAARERVPSQKRGHALLAKAARGLRRRVAVEELECDRRLDVGEDLDRPGPELLEQATQLIRRGDPLADEVVAHADQ